MLKFFDNLFNSFNDINSIVVSDWPKYSYFPIDVSNLESSIIKIFDIAGRPIIISLIGIMIDSNNVKQEFTVSKYLFIKTRFDIEEAVKILNESLLGLEEKYRSESDSTIIVFYALKFSGDIRMMESSIFPIPNYMIKRLITYLKNVLNTLIVKYTYINSYFKIPNNPYIENWNDWKLENDLWVGIIKNIKWNCKITKDNEFINKEFISNDSDKEIILIKDKIIDKNIFIRYYKNSEYLIENGSVIRKIDNINNRYLTKLEHHFSYDKNLIMVMDIECLNINGELIPYAVGLYDNKFKYFYGINCIIESIEYL